MGTVPVEAKAQDVADDVTNDVAQVEVVEELQDESDQFGLAVGDDGETASLEPTTPVVDDAEGASEASAEPVEVQPDEDVLTTDDAPQDVTNDEVAELAVSETELEQEQPSEEAGDVDAEPASEQGDASTADTSRAVGSDGAKTAAAAACNPSVAKTVSRAGTLATQASKVVELPKGATNVKEGTYVIETSVADNKVLGVADKAPAGFSVGTSLSYNGSGNQKWTVKKDAASGWYYIMLSGASEPLALGKAKSSEQLQLLYPERVGDRALWAFVKNGSWFNLVNRSMPECLLAVAGGSKDENAALSFEKASTSGSGRRFYLLDTKPKVKASSAFEEGAYEIAYSENTKIAVDVRGGKKTDNANVILYTYGGKNNQKIYLEADGKGFYTAWILGTQKVLAQSSSSILPGTNVVQKTYAAGAATQLWALHRNADGSYSLVNKATGLALGSKGKSSGSNLIGTRNDGYKTTHFKFVRQALLTPGIVEIHPRTTSKVTLDVQKAASSGNANLLLWKDGNKLNQRFELVAAGGTDLWRIRTASSGGWLTVNSNGVQQVGRGATAQSNANTWRVTFKGGWYSLINKATGKALDVRYGKTNNGTMIIAHKPNGRDSQHFTFNKVDLIDAGMYALRNGGSRYLDVRGASRNEGGNIDVYQKNGALNQMFIFAKKGSTWTIQSAKSGLYLTAAANKNGANVSQRSGGSSKAQLWTLGVADGGAISIKSAANPKLALNATNNGKKNSDNVNIATAGYVARQAWKPVVILSDGALSTNQKKVLASTSRTPSPGYGLCAGWVTNVFENAGIGSWYGDACDQYDWFCKSADLTKLKPGMIIAVRSHGKTWAGSIWGHVGIYVGNGKLKDNIGHIRTISIFDWMDYYGDRVTPKWGWFGRSLR